MCQCLLWCCSSPTSSPSSCPSPCTCCRRGGKETPAYPQAQGGCEEVEAKEPLPSAATVAQHNLQGRCRQQGKVYRQDRDGGGDRVRRGGAVRPQLRQEVPHDVRDRVRESAGGGVRGQLQEVLRHHVFSHGSERFCRGVHEASCQGL